MRWSARSDCANVCTECLWLWHGALDSRPQLTRLYSRLSSSPTLPRMHANGTKHQEESPEEKLALSATASSALRKRRLLSLARDRLARLLVRLPVRLLALAAAVLDVIAAAALFQP